MNQSEKALLDRINSLMAMGGHINDQGGRPEASSDVARQVYAGTLSIASSLYGTSSPQADVVLEMNSRIMAYNWSERPKNGVLILELRGVLANIKTEIESGLIKSIRNQARGEIIADFILLAKDAIDAGVKDVGAVLACAALEDSLKRYAESSGIDVENRDISEVVNSLKAAGKLLGPQAKVVQSFVGVRNKAMHAEWNKIDTSEVHSVISFVQDFITKQFS